jgi:hypothetical protein
MTFSFLTVVIFLFSMVTCFHLFLFGRSFVSGLLDVVDVLLVSGRRLVSDEAGGGRRDRYLAKLTESGFGSVSILFTL